MLSEETIFYRKYAKTLFGQGLANLEKLSAKVSDKVIVITESRKFGRKALVKFAEIADVDAIITDNHLKAIDHELIIRKGVEVFTTLGYNPASKKE